MKLNKGFENMYTSRPSLNCQPAGYVRNIPVIYFYDFFGGKAYKRKVHVTFTC